MKTSYKLLAAASLAALALFTGSLSASAQYTRAADKDAIIALIKENPGRANGNLCPYIAPDDKYTPAPRGYKAFYISHVGRHGSRFHQSTGSFSIIDTLKAYDKAGLLTEAGRWMIGELQQLMDMTMVDPGALTALGRAEHRGICRRMVAGYGRVFRKRHTVNTYSTSTQRVLDSRSSFVEELASLVPGLEINNCDKEEKSGMEVTGFKMTTEEKNARNSIDARTPARALEAGYTVSHFAGVVLKDPSSLSFERTKSLLGKTFSLGRNFANVDTKGVPDFHRYYTPEEMYYASIGSSPDWYLKHGDLSNPATGAERIGAGIAKMIIDDAEEAMEPGSDIAATLRFSHDSYLLPVMTYFGLTSEKEYVDFENICVACNVQIIFLRNRKGDVIVKVMKNEHECLIDGIEPVTGPYYKWSDLKEYLLSRSDLI